MSRTSKALRRLGVAGLAAATIGAGVPALLTGATANAAPPGPTTTLVITPASQSGAAGECLIYQVTPKDANGGIPSDTQSQRIDVNATENPASNTQQLSFCSPSAPHNNVGVMSSLVDAPGGSTPAMTTASLPSPIDATNQFNATGAQYFGLRGAVPGGANITAFVVTGNPPGPQQFNPITQTGGVGNATATFTDGGNSSGAPLTNDQTYGGTPAQNAVRSVTEVPQDPTANPVAAGGQQFVTVQLKNAAGDPVPGAQVSTRFESGSANTNTTPTGTTPTPVTCVGGTSTTTNGVTNNTANPTSPATSTSKSGSQGGPVSNNQGYVTCKYTANNAGSDQLTIYVNQTCGTGSQLDACEPRVTVTRTATAAPNTNPAQARNITLTPDGTTTVSGTPRTFTATVTDAVGKPVQDVPIRFQIRGNVGTFTGPSGTASAACQAAGGPAATGPTALFRIGQLDNECTNAQGIARVTVNTQPGETGVITIDASLQASSQCSQAAGAGTPVGTTAGNCVATASTNYVASSPSPSPSASPSATPSASPPTNPPGQKGTLTTSTPDIQPNIQGVLNASGLTANAVYELRCYSRPNTTYFTARTATVSANNSTLEFRILPGTNTRCYIRPAGNDGLASNSVVINVHTTLSLSAYRDGVRQYHFQGRNLPRLAGQLITLYRIDNGKEIRTAIVKTNTSGIWRIDRKFLGSGEFVFVARSGQTLNNAPGRSNERLTIIH